MEDDYCIAVTHFINPHLFWYKRIEVPGEQFRVLSVVEESLLKLYKNKPSCDQLLRPHIGDKVAVNFIAWNKYIRAEILQRAEFRQEEYIVWAIDYGFPLLTKKECIRNLPSSLHINIGLIHVGGIANIFPAEQEYDDMEGNLVMVKKDKWLQKTCNMLEKLLVDANSVSFFKRFETENEHAWGDLIIINHKGIQINARDYLLKTTNAIEENEVAFKNNCSKFKSIKIAPWLTNDRNTKMKYNSIRHTYIEHSKHIDTVLIDENAKRKVEDWQQRNERKKVEAVADILENYSELPDDNIDDVTFDDSVSVANKQLNYIGKAGVLTKIKQQKYSTDKHTPPSAHPKFFEMDMLFDTNSPTEQQCTEKQLQPNITDLLKEVDGSSTTEFLNNHDKSYPLIDLESESSSSKASAKLRQKNLHEMRLKVARAEKEKRIKNSTAPNSIHNHNETINSAVSQSKTSDSYPYQLLEQSSTLSTLNNTGGNNIQENQSELSVKNIRVKHLMAMRKKFASSTFSSSTHSCQIDTTTESKETENNVKSLDKLNFQLKPKTTSNPKQQVEQLPHIYSVISSANKMKNEDLKSSQSGYESLTFVPAGFDVTRLQSYKDEQNHWHRKKSTLHDYVPHEQSSSTDELLSNNTNDQSFSSSDFSLTKSLKELNQNSSNKFISNSLSNNKIDNPNFVQDSLLKACPQLQDGRKEFSFTNIAEKNVSCELSTSSTLSQFCQKVRKRRQLKSPTSQLSKIDQILLEHCIEKESGNKNILDLQLLNSSSSSHKTLSTKTSSNISESNNDKPYVLQNNNLNINTILNEKVCKEISSYETLIDVKHTEHLPIVEGERNIQTKFIDHLVLAHSSVQLAPVENVSDAPFLSEIHEEMRQMRVNKVYRIQVYSWSHVLRNNSLFVVNPSRSGKTWSYLPSVCNLLCCRKDSFKPSYGPMAIILVASLKHVELVNNYCRRLMNGLKAEAPTCIASYGMRNLIETKINLLNGCGILVATPSNILRLLQDNETEPLFDAERLQHIVIDDMDIMMSRSQRDFEEAYRTLFKMAKKTKFKKLSPQLIVTSRDWDGLIVKFIRKSNQPLLLIGDFLEAAVYGRATLSVKLKSSAKKNETILKFLKQKLEFGQSLENRTLIMCNGDEDVQNVHKFLQEFGYPCLSFWSRSTENEHATIDEWRKNLSSQILICTDNRFYELKIQNVNNLIHFSMPTSWTQFTTRFSALARTYNNYVIDFDHDNLGGASDDKNYRAHSMILLDENNNLQLPRLVDFMQKHNQKVQDEILAVSKRILIMREELRILNISPLCPQLLEFGECDEPRCDDRHELTRFDFNNKRDGVPSSGEIRIHVLKVFSPTHYAVRLLNHKPFNSNKWLETRHSSEALTFSMQLNMHYHDKNNLFLHWPPHINDICIYQYAENFRRALIFEAPTFQHKSTNVVQTNLKVSLKLIDDGIVINSVKCNEIFVCDDKFKQFPHQAIDVRLMKVVPFDNERCWDSKTTKQVQKWILEDIKPNYVVQASIDFSLSNTIWVKNLVVMEKLTGIDAYCQIVNLKKSLVEKNFGVLYNGDRKHVRDLAAEFDRLNLSQFTMDSGDSDFDYQSCKNESTNLIKFSSSSDEATNSSMESAQPVREELENKNINMDGNRKETKSADNGIDILTRDDDNENWDDNLDNDPQLVEVYNPYQIQHVNKIDLPKKETWTKLNLKELVKVEIGDEGENGNWENIFLQIIDHNSMFLFDEMNKLIIKHVNKLKLNKTMQKENFDFEPQHNCIVKYNNLYLRAKVYGVYGENLKERLYRFFLCDYACFTNAKTEELYNDFLYDTTQEIIGFTPYQAIHCTLAGIKWDRFTKRYQVTKDHLYACAVLENDTKQNSTTNLHNLSIHSYKILLYECEKENEFKNAFLFNKALIDNGITVYDEETKNYLEYEIGLQERSSDIVNDKSGEKFDVPVKYDQDQVLTCEQLIDSIKSNAFDIEIDDIFEDVKITDVSDLKCKTNESENQECISDCEKDKTMTSTKIVLNEKSNVPTSNNQINEQNHISRIENNGINSSISTDISSGSELDLPLPYPPPLKALYKRPLTVWYQNDFMIFLSIYAPDVKDYILEITSNTILFIADIQFEKSVLMLNLLGSIDTKSVSHELKGLNVVIRLKKNVFIEWPRLLRPCTKYPWLKYNFNIFDSIEKEYIMPQQLLHTILDTKLNFSGQQVDNYNSDDDNERELYQTYNPIQNSDDDCDPFSEF